MPLPPRRHGRLRSPGVTGTRNSRSPDDRANAFLSLRCVKTLELHGYTYDYGLRTLHLCNINVPAMVDIPKVTPMDSSIWVPCERTQS